MQAVRVRFSPSPTGHLHIGGARTAFYNWLLARNTGGTFILRVEDTDQERKVPGAVTSLLRVMNWFGIMPDEGPSHEELKAIGEDPSGIPKLSGSCGPYIQSLRLAKYAAAAEQLIASGHAYRCDCTPEMIEQERLEQMARKEAPGYSGYCRTRNVPADKPHVVRFKMPIRTSVTVDDYIRGKVVFESASLKDTILFKSDGFATYHLALVVDDTEMKISHILRGQEWLSTAPLHVLLFQALNYPPPIFVHLPTIMGKDGKKLSKREGSVSCEAFQENGYLPEALLNFTALIGWSAGKGEEQEIFTREELVQRFSLDGLNNASGVFDFDKLDWMNGAYIRALAVDDFIGRAKPFIERAGLAYDHTAFSMIAAQVQERVKTLKEVPEMVEFLFRDDIIRDFPSMYQKGIDEAKAKDILVSGLEILRGLREFTKDNTEEALRPLTEKFQVKAGPLFGVFRIAVTGKKITPPLFESFVALGRERTLHRIEEALALLGK